MATPAMMPAGWYADPTRRHECRYWGGTDWTGAVSDGAVTATDPLESASQPPPPSFSLRSLRLSLRSLRHSTRLSSRRSPLRPCPPWCGADGGAVLLP